MRFPKIPRIPLKIILILLIVAILLISVYVIFFNFKDSLRDVAIWLTNTDLDFNIPTAISLKQRISGLVIVVADKK